MLRRIPNPGRDLSGMLYEVLELEIFFREAFEKRVGRQNAYGNRSFFRFSEGII
jgi:hypothetical protein